VAVGAPDAARAPSRRRLHEPERRRDDHHELEWATSCPPPRHNVTELPRIRSERPAFELHYPEYVERYRNEAHVGGRASPFEVAAQGAAQETQPNDDPRSR
jgi:cytochrome c oxidase subunit 1